MQVNDSDINLETFNDIPIMPFRSDADWEAWLKDNHTLQSGIWLKIAKKDSGVESVNHAEALDVALCYGWIDGQRRSFDNIYFLQKFTGRRARSLWSKVNIGKVEKLIAAGRMQASGMQEIMSAKNDGRWDVAYESPKNATIPPDLMMIFERDKQVKEYFMSLNKTNQYAVLWRLMTARTPGVRAARLEKIMEVLKAGKTFL
jgi:uncharacterized protein YdeI (YjbR/CyaY-like superfamily)